ncbi:MAG: beta-propeller domain-containing protein [Candidatus Thermoplasmatota archaeon]|nr:beta-propeller domain-containing protein [Candidatus Thermoplasmatota archaeon]MBU1941530.1 beta-propeller domain-containing protein [Candidatus Thermoplasmatota archaeon]
MMIKNTRTYGLLIAGLIVAGTFGYAFLSQPSVIGGIATFDMKQFSSYDELTSYVALGTSGGYYSSTGLRNEESAMIDSSFNALPGAQDLSGDGKSQDSGGTSVDYSQTNIQVAGVDEPDVVKTDGTYLYIIVNNEIIIVAAYPTENATIIARINFDANMSLNTLFIYENRLIAFVNSYNYDIVRTSAILEDDVGKSIPWYSSPDTYIYIYDLSNIDSPSKEKEIVIGGSFTSARMINSYVYLITTQYTYGINEDQQIVPRLLVNEEIKDIPLTDIYYVDIPEKSSTFTNIISFDASDPSADILAEVYLLGNGNIIYVSQNNIYVTYPLGWYDYTQLETIMKDFIMPLIPDSYTTELGLVEQLSLEDYQKSTVTEWILQTYVTNLNDLQKQQLATAMVEQMERTIIHRISINNGDITYESQGSVPGSINNQFSLSEHNGYLRVATTINGWIARSYLTDYESTNNIYVLDMALDIVGQVTGLAEGEQIYATRYVDDLCYLVTFKQIDPFFVIDLSQPTNPEVLGELKIPGFSTYLHPYDDTHIIGIGRDEQEVKITLFDVTDLQNPQELDTYIIENDKNQEWIWTQSTALYDHKAFLFSKEKNLLVIPVGTYAIESAYVFDISIEDGINLKGTVTHDYTSNGDEQPDEPWKSSIYPSDYGNSIQRSLYIEDVLYTISNNMVKMNNLNTLTELNEILLI